MAKEKAKEFLEHLVDNPDLVEKMKGFTKQELNDAMLDLKKSGRVKSEDEVLPHDFC